MTTDALSQTDQALELIRSSIIDLRLAPSSRIDEPLLLSQFGLGRTPAREALNRLTAEGFVRIAPNRGGAFVRGLDLHEMLEVITAQQVVEQLLGQLINLDDESLVEDLEALQREYADVVTKRDYLAITAVNEAFHLRMHRCVENSFLFDFAQSTHRHVRRLNVYIYRLEAANPSEHRDLLASNSSEHDEIIEHIRARDRDALADLLRRHSQTSHKRLLNVMDQIPAPIGEIMVTTDGETSHQPQQGSDLS
ncbi:GntR family transcriptional regulator [Sciscionella sediminilitoris]|uniref:GntR family transcriptional regulator n=1 Tax=Sciscionella sediminilitoris TaxID=1445613 RepID=UPI0009EA2C75|nr:GntR family transcriptional regulator [Sciscionella sp. SE31]